MASARSIPYRRAAALAGCLTLASLHACSDRQPTSAAPDAEAASQASGAWSSTVWSVGPAGLTYSGGITGRASTTDGGRRLGVERESVRALSLSASDLEARRAALQGSLPRVPTPSKGAPARAGTPTLRMELRGAPTFTTRTSDGKELKTQLLGGPRGGGRPAGVLVSVGGRTRALIQYSHARDGRLLSARSTLFGADGRPERVIESDFRGMTGSKARRVSAMDRMLGGAGRLAAGLGSLVGPTPLCAQNNCDAEQLAWSQAYDAFNQADWDLQEAYRKCSATSGQYPPPDPDPCGQPLLDAQAAYDQANWNLIVARHNLDQCHFAPPPPPPGGGGGGGGGEDDGMTCYRIDWYVSWDDGKTWEYLDSEYYCEQNEE